MGFKPNWNAYWAPTIADMLRIGVKAFACCQKCGCQKVIDLAALIEKVGPDYCLKNRRCRCRLKPGCDGWNYFAHNRSGGIIVPFRDAATADRWIFIP